MPRRLPSRPAWVALCTLVLAASPARSDTIVLESGKRIEGVVVSERDDVVVINPWNSRHPEMTWEIPDANRISKDKVAEVIIEETPLVEYRQRASRRDLSADEHVELAEFCGEHKFTEERERHLLLALCLEPTHESALELLGAAKWRAWAKLNAESDPDIREREREYVKLQGPAELEAQLDMMRGAGSKRPLVYLERARRSAALKIGLREKVPLTLRSEQSPGGTYCIYVPRSYDPLVPTPLVVGLHGGGRGGAPGEVNGSGEQAMPFYIQLAEQWGWIVVCPSALQAPWSANGNEPLVDATVDEMKMLYNVDLNRVYVTGHSMGGFGSFYWGPHREDLWAAYSPCAGGGSPGSCKLPIYIYHGTDDHIVGPSSSRAAAKSLGGGGKKKKRKKRGGVDFVYTEISGVGHGFPEWVRKDIFRFFAGRWKDRGKKRATGPRSSFDAKVSKEEIKTFGDPSESPGDDGEGDAKLKDLIKAINKGGGGGQEAAKELGTRKDKATVKALARILRSKKATSDSRVLAAHAIGDIGLPESVKALATVVKDEDYHVVEGAVVGLGRTGLAEAAEPLAKAAKYFGEKFEGAIQGDKIRFDSYRIRLGSLRLVADAYARVGQPDVAIPVLDAEIATRVFSRKPKLDYHIDDRFTHIPPRARLELVRSLRAALLQMADPRGVPLLEAVRDNWEKQPAVLAEAESGLAELSRAD